MVDQDTAGLMVDDVRNIISNRNRIEKPEKGTYSDYMVCQICERRNNVEVKRELWLRHITM